LICIVFTLGLSLVPSAYAQSRRHLTLEISNAEKRVALVIGNSTYTAAPLKNPVNDARDMAQSLVALGFEVIHRENLNQNDMKRSIRAFGEKIRGGGIGLFYYAGHGVQVRGINYLIPVDAKVEGEEEVEYECVDAGFVLAQMENARNRMNIMILDACRNNPFARSFRSASRGLAQMDAPSGTLIAYSTAPGSVASDGNARNGIYTQELLKFIRTSNLSIEEVFKRVRISVRKLTQSKQTPWESSSLTGDFYFTGSATPKGSTNSPSEASLSSSKNTEQPQPITSQTPKPVTPQTWKRQSNFYTFELKKCTASGPAVVCDFIVTNTDQNRWLAIHQDSKMFDNFSNQSDPSRISLGDKDNSGWGWAKKFLIGDIQIPARIVFNNVSTDTTKIVLLQLHCDTSGSSDPDSNYTHFNIEFKNVPLRE